MSLGFENFIQSGKGKGEMGYDVPEGVDVRGRFDPDFAKILSKDALRFVADLHREFRGHVKYAMSCREAAKSRYNGGALPGFDPTTKYIREGEWLCAPVPPAVADRKVEITGPVERKMVINALNSGAKVFMSLKDGCLGEFEDALLTIVKCICSPSKYFAQMLYTCLNGRRVDKGGLVRIMISRAEIDLDEIQLMFKNKHGLELKDAICESIPQGDYREFLVMLATKPSKRARLGSL